MSFGPTHAIPEADETPQELALRVPLLVVLVENKILYCCRGVTVLDDTAAVIVFPLWSSLR